MRKLKDIREELGFSIEECAKILDISPSTYRTYEKQPLKFKMDQVYILAKTFQVNIQDVDWYHSSMA